MRLYEYLLQEISLTKIINALGRAKDARVPALNREVDYVSHIEKRLGKPSIEWTPLEKENVKNQIKGLWGKSFQDYDSQAFRLRNAFEKKLRRELKGTSEEKEKIIKKIVPSEDDLIDV